MRIQWNQDVRLETAEDFNSDCDCNFDNEKEFQAGEVSIVEPTATYQNAVDFSFPDGMVAYAVPNDWFTVLNR